MNREEYLLKAAEVLRVRLFKPTLFELPEVKVSVGFPKGRKQAAPFQYWPKAKTTDGVGQIFINPSIGTSYEAIRALVVACAYAAVDPNEPLPSTMAGSILAGIGWDSLEAAPTDELADKIAKLADFLGDYPHTGLNVPQVKPQKGKLVAFVCKHKGCGYKVWTTRKHIARGLPWCGAADKGHAEMQEARP
jgi:hypothetical protein